MLRFFFFFIMFNIIVALGLLACEHLVIKFYNFIWEFLYLVINQRLWKIQFNVMMICRKELANLLQMILTEAWIKLSFMKCGFHTNFSVQVQMSSWVAFLYNSTKQTTENCPCQTHSHLLEIHAWFRQGVSPVWSAQVVGHSAKSTQWKLQCLTFVFSHTAPPGNQFPGQERRRKHSEIKEEKSVLLLYTKSKWDKQF